MPLLYFSSPAILFASWSECCPWYLRITEGSFPYLSASVKFHWSNANFAFILWGWLPRHRHFTFFLDYINPHTLCISQFRLLLKNTIDWWLKQQKFSSNSFGDWKFEIMMLGWLDTGGLSSWFADGHLLSVSSHQREKERGSFVTAPLIRTKIPSWGPRPPKFIKM